jgi:hypothetical protein
MEAVEHVTDSPFALRGLDLFVEERGLQVFIDRQVIDQVIALEDETDLVDLPAPEGPMTVRNSPCRTSKLMFRKTKVFTNPVE